MMKTLLNLRSCPSPPKLARRLSRLTSRVHLFELRAHANSAPLSSPLCWRRSHLYLWQPAVCPQHPFVAVLASQVCKPFFTPFVPSLYARYLVKKLERLQKYLKNIGTWHITISQSVRQKYITLKYAWLHWVCICHKIIAENFIFNFITFANAKEN